MKNKIISMYVKDLGNHTSLLARNSLKNRPIAFNPKSKNEIGFGSLVGAVLLNYIVSYIGSLFFITDCSVSYKLSNVLGCLMASK